jgi:AraC family transcriptional regulator
MPVLVVTEKANHKLYCSLDLKAEKIKICTPKETLHSIKKRSTDIILLDPGFAVERGLRLLKEMKSRFPSIPVIFLTGNASEDIVLRAFRAGVRDFFRKPVNIQELQDTVMDLLRLKRSSKERRSPFVKRRNAGSGKPVRTATTSQPVSFFQTIQLIEKHLTYEIKLETLARSACMSKYHFCRLFKKRVGISPMKFVTFMRIEKAKELLRKDDTISSIAIDVGFNDLSSFIAQFKKFTSMTPSIYRKSLK